MSIASAALGALYAASLICLYASKDESLRFFAALSNIIVVGIAMAVSIYAEVSS